MTGPNVTGPTGNGQPGTEQEQADRLAERLLQAHRRVRAAELSTDDKGRVTRRLIALTDASKHDVPRASARLDALIADLDAGRVSPD